VRTKREFIAGLAGVAAWPLAVAGAAVACYEATSIDQTTLLSASAHSAMATDKTIS